MRPDVRTYLIEVARKGQMCTYSEVSDACKLGLLWEGDADSGEIGRILGEISVYEFEYNRPLLNAVVVRKGTAEQGKGFYTLCEDLGLGSVSKLKKNFFGILEVKKCHDYWSDDSKYFKYL